MNGMTHAKCLVVQAGLDWPSRTSHQVKHVKAPTLAKQTRRVI